MGFKTYNTTDDSKLNTLLPENIQVGVIASPIGVAYYVLCSNQPAYNITIGVKHTNTGDLHRRQ